MSSPPPLLPGLALMFLVAGGGLWWWSRSDAPVENPPPTVDPRPQAKSSAARWRDALRDTDRGRRSARFATVWNGMTAAEAAALAPELLAHEAGSPFQNDWLDFLERWGALDPRAALAFAAERGGGLAGDWTRSIARGWATADPHAAAAWWLAEASSDREALGSLIVGRWAETDWRAAADWVQSQVAASEQPDLANALAIQILGQDPDAAAALVDACLGRPAPPTALETSLFSQLVRTLPLSHLEPFKEVFPRVPALHERVEQLMAEPVTESNPPHPGAKSWFLWLDQFHQSPVLPLPLGQPDYRLREDAFRHWLAADHEDASRWLGDQDPSPLKDACTKTLVLATAEDDPAAAQAWLRSMTTEARHSLFMNWPRPAKPASRDWITEFMSQDGFPVELLRDE